MGNAQKALEEASVPENNEILISYVHKAKNGIEIIFSFYNIFQMALDIIQIMKIPNHKMWKIAKKEIIDQNGKRLCM